MSLYSSVSYEDSKPITPMQSTSNLSIPKYRCDGANEVRWFLRIGQMNGFPKRMLRLPTMFIAHGCPNLMHVGYSRFDDRS